MSTRALWIVLAAGVVGAGCSPKLTGAKCDYDTNCPSGQTCQKAAGAASGQCVNQCSIKCSAGMTCGFASGQAACQCPPNTTGTFVVDPVQGSGATDSPFPTGVNAPASCRFKRLTDAVPWANDYATFSGTTPGATVVARTPTLPVDFSGESFPLVIGSGVSVTTDTLAPPFYVVHLTTDAGVLLSPGASLSGYTLEDETGTVTGAVSCVSSGAQPASLGAVRLVLFDGGLSAAPAFGVSYSDGGQVLPPTGLVVSGGCVLNASGIEVDTPGVGIQVTSGATASVDGGQILASAYGLLAGSGTFNGAAITVEPAVWSPGIGVLANGSAAVNLSQTTIRGYDSGIYIEDTAKVALQGGTVSGSLSDAVDVFGSGQLSATGTLFTDAGTAAIFDMSSDGGTPGTVVQLNGATLRNAIYAAFLHGNAVMNIQGGQTYGTGYGIWEQGTNQCYFFGLGAPPTLNVQGLTIGSTAFPSAQYGIVDCGGNLTVQNSTVDFTQYLGLYVTLDPGDLATFQANTFSGNAGPSMEVYQSYLTDAGQPSVSIDGNIVDGGAGPPVVLGQAGPLAVSFTNNIVHYAVGDAVQLAGVAGSPFNVIFEGNEIAYSTGHGLHLVGTQPTGPWTFQDNRLHGNAGGGVYADSSGSTWNVSAPNCGHQNFFQCYTAGTTFGVSYLSTASPAPVIYANNAVWDVNPPVAGSDYMTGVNVSTACPLPVNPPVCP